MARIKKIIEYGLYLLAFTLPLQTRWIIKPGGLNGGYFEYGTISLYGTDIFIIMLLCFFILLVIYRRVMDSKEKELDDMVGVKGLKEHKYTYTIRDPRSAIRDKQYSIFELRSLIIGLLAVSFISVCWAPSPILALFVWGRLLLGTGLFLLIAKTDYDIKKLKWSFIGGVFLQAVLAIWQFLSQSTFSNKWLGMALHNPYDLGVSVVETAAGRWLRAYGGLDQPNILGGLLTIGLLMMIFLMIKSDFLITTHPSAQLRAGKLPITFILKRIYFIYWLVYLTLVSALFFTFSRSAWIGAIVAIFFTTIMVIRGKEPEKKKKLYSVILFSILAISILFFINSDLVFTRIKANTRLEIISSEERIESVNEAFKILSDNWLLGNGIGNYTLSEEKYRPNLASYNYQPVHNTYLLVLGELGIIGLILYLLVIFYIFIKGNLEGKAIIIVILTTMFFDHWWWSLHYGIILFFFLLGYIVKNKKHLL